MDRLEALGKEHSTLEEENERQSKIRRQSARQPELLAKLVTLMRDCSTNLGDLVQMQLHRRSTAHGTASRHPATAPTAARGSVRKTKPQQP